MSPWRHPQADKNVPPTLLPLLKREFLTVNKATTSGDTKLHGVTKRSGARGRTALSRKSRGIDLLNRAFSLASMSRPPKMTCKTINWKSGNQALIVWINSSVQWEAVQTRAGLIDGKALGVPVTAALGTNCPGKGEMRSSADLCNSAARHCNLQRAADDLNLTLSAVSQRPNQLEIDLGVTLLESQVGGVYLIPRHALRGGRRYRTGHGRNSVQRTRPAKRADQASPWVFHSS